MGRELCRQLLAKPDTESVTCLTRGQRLTSTLISHPNLRYWLGDITQCKFPDESFTDLIHGANEANDLMQPDQYRYYYTIVEGTRRILSWAEGRITRKLVLSSGAVDRDTVYGQAKRQCELLANEYGGCKIARIFSLLGEEMPLNGQFASGKFVHMALNDGKVKLWGGASQRTYLHVEDCVKELLAILDDGGTSYPYEVAGNVPMTMLELAQMVSVVFDVPLERIDGADRVDVYLPSLGRTNLFQTISTKAALERIRDYHLRNTDVLARKSA